jgi:hypothetical protein
LRAILFHRVECDQLKWVEQETAKRARDMVLITDIRSPNAESSTGGRSRMHLREWVALASSQAMETRRHHGKCVLPQQNLRLSE